MNPIVAAIVTAFQSHGVEAEGFALAGIPLLDSISDLAQLRGALQAPGLSGVVPSSVIRMITIRINALTAKAEPPSLDELRERLQERHKPGPSDETEPSGPGF